jgi:hypothetical protein
VQAYAKRLGLKGAGTFDHWRRGTAQLAGAAPA